jgi:hypothetical protein
VKGAVNLGIFAVSGTLARVSFIGITTEYPVRLGIPQKIDRDQVRPGMSGTATVLAPNAGVMECVDPAVGQRIYGLPPSLNLVSGVELAPISNAR